METMAGISIACPQPTWTGWSTALHIWANIHSCSALHLCTQFMYYVCAVHKPVSGAIALD